MSSSMDSWEDLVGVAEWSGPPAPVILVSDPDQRPDVQENYPRAAVLSLPDECELWTAVESWPLYLPLLGADVTLWPASQRDAAILRAICPVLDVAGVRTLRWATTQGARWTALETVWKDRPPLR